MQAWLASPYRAVGIYFGGSNRACTQPNLTAAWVSEQIAAGWHLIPLYVGRQAPCTMSSKPFRIDPAQAAAQGTAEADDAADQAAALGLAADSVLINDMEAYQTGNAACTSAVNTYIGAWTAQLHERGYLSGFYSSIASGVTDQVAAYSTPGYAHPDHIDFARWDGVATTSDPAIPATYWPGPRRIKQYAGDHAETWGGVTINIDNDYLAVAPIPATPFGDFTGNGWSDLLGRQTTSGLVIRYSGNGYGFGPTQTIASEWTGFNAITRFGDFDGDGLEDLLAREASTGFLYLYRWTGSAFAPRQQMGAGWNTMREITAVGDLNGDGFNDLVAVETATGNLFFYPGNGSGLPSRTKFNAGWNTVDELVGAGDFDRDGHVDLFAREKSTGFLYFYASAGVALKPRVKMGEGWNTVRSLASVGDFDRDGFTDVIAIETSTGKLFLYRGTGAALPSRTLIGTGWGSIQPLF